MSEKAAPKTISEWFEKGRQRFHKPDGVGAVNAFERVIDMDPRYRHTDGDTAYFYLGKIYEVEGRLTDAIVHYSRALAINRHDEESMIGRVSCYTVTGRHEEAISDLNRLMQLPENSRKVPRKLLLYVMAENYRRMEDWGQAVYWGQQASAADPGNKDFQTLLKGIQAKTAP